MPSHRRKPYNDYALGPSSNGHYSSGADPILPSLCVRLVLRVVMYAAVAMVSLALAASASAAPDLALGFGEPEGGTVLDAQGLGTGFSSVQSNTAGDQLQAGRLALRNGNLTVVSGSGDLVGDTQQNLLQTSFDGTSSFRVWARLIGPVGLTSAQQGGGIVVGPGQDDYVMLVVERGAGGPRIRLAREVGGVLSSVEVSEPGATAAASLDLALEVAATGQVTGRYRIGSGATKTIGPTTHAGIGGTTARAGILTTNSGTSSPVSIIFDHFVIEPLDGSGGGPVSFNPRRVIVSAANAPGIQLPTSLTVGPDGKLYVAQQNGKIHVFSLDPGHSATFERVITTIHDRANTNRDGTAAPTVVGRQVTGIAFDPSPSNGQPVLYVSHSDPRIFYNRQPGQLQTNIRSGTVTRLVGPSFDASSGRDLVVGLPRSGENHSPNGMAMGPDGWLYLGIGGDTNQGGVSQYFSYIPELPLSASVVRIKPDAITSPINAAAGSTFTFSDPCIGTETVGSGCSAAHSWVGSPSSPATGEVAGAFEIYSTGFRNPYDIVWHSNGRLYANDNEGNSGIGATPGPADNCPSSTPVDVSPTPNDDLVLVQQNAYHGHPNPSRGECTRNGGSGLRGPYRAPLLTYTTGRSTNGIVEYAAPNFGGQLRGQILSANYGVGDNIARVKLSADGQTVVEQGVLATGFSDPLDLWVLADGAILVAEHGGATGVVSVIEPVGGAAVCPSPGFVPGTSSTDSDADGYTDQDEIDNGASRCNASDRPADADGDRVSDLNDPDDDNDAVSDATDPLQLDATNGAGTALPFVRDFNTSDAGGFFGTGFLGVQPSSRGGGPLASLLSAGAAGGYLQMIATPGTMTGSSDSQNNAIQQGFTPLGAFTVRATIGDPFLAGGADGQEASGIYIGPGEGDYVRLAVAAGVGGPAIELAIEQGSNHSRSPASPPLPSAASTVELLLQGNPAAATVTAGYRVNGGPVQAIATMPVPAAWLNGTAIAGMMSTSAGSGQAQPFVYDEFRIESGPGVPIAGLGARVLSRFATTFGTGTFVVRNTSTTDAVSRVVIDLASGPAMFRDLVFDPADGSPAGDTTTKSFTIDSTIPGGTAAGIHPAASINGSGFNVLQVDTTDFDPGEELKFSVDVDPTSIQGAAGYPTPGGGQESGADLEAAADTAYVAVGVEDGRS